MNLDGVVHGAAQLTKLIFSDDYFLPKGLIGHNSAFYNGLAG